MNTVIIVIACLITFFIGFVVGYMLSETYTYDYEHFTKQLETELRHEKNLYFYVGDIEVTRWGDGSYVLRLPE